MPDSDEQTSKGPDGNNFKVAWSLTLTQVDSYYHVCPRSHELSPPFRACRRQYQNRQRPFPWLHPQDRPPSLRYLSCLPVRLHTLIWTLGRAQDLELNVHGAPNFRAPRYGSLNVFGVAQPRTQGLRAILSILRCRPNTPSPSHVVWFSTREEPISKSILLVTTVYISPYTVYISGRPFVLRDAAEPRRTLSISDRAENLEAIEARLKTDILQEASRYVSAAVLTPILISQI